MIDLLLAVAGELDPPFAQPGGDDPDLAASRYWANPPVRRNIGRLAKDAYCAGIWFSSSIILATLRDAYLAPQLPRNLD